MCKEMNKHIFQMIDKMYTKQSPDPIGRPRSSLLKPHSENIIYDIHSTESSANYIFDADVIASRNRYLYCSFCHRKLLSKAGLTNHEKFHIRNELKQKRLEQYAKRKPRVFTCKHCGEVFPKRGELNQHSKIHINVIKCNYCKETFQDRMAFEIHDAIEDGKNFESLNFPVYRTRSQSRLSCHSVNRVRSQSYDGSSRSSSRMSMSSMVLPYESDRDSVWDNRTIVNDFSDITSQISDRGLSPWTEADFVQKKFICSDANCREIFPTLHRVTLHEIHKHKKLPLFKCMECRKRFTTSGNLYCHKTESHTMNTIICGLCDNTLHGFEAIDEHVLLHQKFSVKCDVCSMMFLSKYYLDQHLKYRGYKHENYRATKGKILIRVDRRETQKFIDLNKISSEICLKFPTSDTDTEVDYSRMDDLPWRS